MTFGVCMSDISYFISVPVSRRRTFAPKCAACLQPILPTEVSNTELSRARKPGLLRLVSLAKKEPFG